MSMCRRFLLLTLFIGLCSFAMAAGTLAVAQTAIEPASLPPQFVGVWKLLSIEDVRSDGKPGYDIDLGRDLTGYMVVDQGGLACVQGMKRERPKWTETHDKAEATDTEFLAYGRGFFGYCISGIQVHGNALTGTVQTSNDPNEVGQPWSRPFSFEGDRLLLTPAFDEAGVHIQRRATFSKVQTSTSDTLTEKIIGAAISRQGGMQFLETLTDRIGGRLTGSPESAAGASLILDSLRSAGFTDAHLEEYPIEMGWRRGEAKARVISPVTRPIYIGSYGWVPGTDGAVQAPVVEATMLSNGMLDLSPAVMKNAAVLVNIVTGSNAYATNYIVLRSRAFQQCAKAGAVAMLIPSDKPHRMLYTSAFGMYPRAPIPVLSVAKEDAEYLRRLLKKGTVRLELDIRNEFLPHPGSERNVVAEINGTGSDIVIVGVHFDSWDVAQGANDNGSGVAAALDAARILKSLTVKPKATIRFVFFSGEEENCIGSRAYVEAHKAELDRIRMYVVMDGGAQAPIGISVKGRRDLVAPLTRVADVLKPLGANRVLPEGEVGSDDETFISLGIPAIELMTETGEYDTNHHAITDTLDKIDPRSLAADTAALALISWELANADSAPGRRLRAAELTEFLSKSGLLEGIRVTHGANWIPE